MRGLDYLARHLQEGCSTLLQRRHHWQDRLAAAHEYPPLEATVRGSHRRSTESGGRPPRPNGETVRFRSDACRLPQSSGQQSG